MVVRQVHDHRSLRWNCHCGVVRLVVHDVRERTPTLILAAQSSHAVLHQSRAVRGLFVLHFQRSSSHDHGVVCVGDHRDVERAQQRQRKPEFTRHATVEKLVALDGHHCVHVAALSHPVRSLHEIYLPRDTAQLCRMESRLLLLHSRNINRRGTQIYHQELCSEFWQIEDRVVVAHNAETQCNGC